MMDHLHLEPDALERILSLDRTADQNRNLLHQIAVCPECREAGGYLLELHDAGLLPPVFGAVDLALAKSRAAAPLLWKRLSSYPQEVRLGLVRGSRSFASWGLCELLCQEAERLGFHEVAQALEVAEVTVLIADSLDDDEPAEDRWLYQLRAYAWAHLANARRIAGDLTQADAAFTMADSWWEAGEMEVGDALGYESFLLKAKASLRTAQRRFPEALELLDRAFEIYTEGSPDQRDRHAAGRILVQKAFTAAEMQDLESAVDLLQRAEGYVDPGREPRLLLCLRHNRVDNLNRLHRYTEARALLPSVQAISREIGNALDQVRLRWVEARIDAGLGDREAARTGLVEVRREFLAREMSYDAALVSLELALLSIEDGRTAEVQELAEEMTLLFQSLDVQPEFFAALAMFQQAAALESATAASVRQILRLLEKARGKPETMAY
jgi:tetratricopeptide (TPR) repeat protein